MNKNSDKSKLKKFPDSENEFESMKIKKLPAKPKRVTIHRCDFKHGFIFDRICKRLGVANLRHCLEISLTVVNFKPGYDPEPSW